MMITDEDVLKAIIECQNLNGRTNYRDIMSKLSIDDISLLPFLKDFNQKGYITQTTEDVTITALGLSAYNDLRPDVKVKKSLYNFTEFTLQRFIDIGIGVAIGLVTAYFTHHFGW